MHTDMAPESFAGSQSGGSARLCHISLLLAAIHVDCSDGSTATPQIDGLGRIEMEEAVRIGSIDDPDVGFSSIGSVMVGRAGTIYVFDRREVAIRIYDSNGALVKRVGGPGEGPGEFRSPSTMGFIADTLWVADTGLRRISLFKPEGDFIRSMRMPSVPVPLTADIQGQLIAAGLRDDGFFNTGWMIPVRRDMPADSFWMPHVRMDSAGAIVDTIQLQRFGFGPRRERVTVGDREFLVPAGPSADPLWIDAGDEAYVVERPIATSAATGEFSVTRIIGLADTVFRRSYSYHPRPFDQEDIDGTIEKAVANYRRQPEMDADRIAAALARAFVAPAFHPPVLAGRVGHDGVLWLQREDRGGTSQEWLLLSPIGEAIGVVELPRASVVHWSDGSTIWVAEPDEDDIPWLIKYYIRM